MKTKKCSKCGEVKPVSEFSKDKNRKDGLQRQCKSCAKQYYQDHREENKQYNQDYREEKKQYHRQYYQDHKEERKQYHRQYKQDHREEKKQYDKQYNQDHKEERKQYNRQYKQDHREEKKQYRRQYENKKYKTDTTFRLRSIISKAIWKSIKRNKNGYHWEDLVGYTLDDLKQHLEKQFKDGMSWDNYGYDGWHIDHKKPVSWFNFTSYEDEEFKQCWALENLQPKWAEDNMVKGNRYID